MAPVVNSAACGVFVRCCCEIDDGKTRGDRGGGGVLVWLCVEFNGGKLRGKCDAAADGPDGGGAKGDMSPGGKPIIILAK